LTDFKTLLDNAVYAAVLAKVGNTQRSQIEQLISKINERADDLEGVLYFEAFLMRQASKGNVDHRFARKVIEVCNMLNNDRSKIREFLGLLKWSFETVDRMGRVNAREFERNGFDMLKRKFLGGR